MMRRAIAHHLPTDTQPVPEPRFPAETRTPWKGADPATDCCSSWLHGRGQYLT